MELCTVKKILFSTVCLLLVSCVSTRITSVTDPQYKSFIIDKVVVVVNTSDLDLKIKMESNLVSELNKKGVIAFNGYDVLPPTRNYSENDLKNIFAKNNIDSILFISIAEMGYSQQTLTTYQPYTSQGTITRMGSNQYQYSMQTQGGPQTHTITKPRLNIITQLFDAKNGNKIWMSTARSSGNAFASINDTFKDYVIEIVKKLEDDHLIIKTKTEALIRGEGDEKDSVKKNTGLARIEDIPIAVRNQALKEMTKDELEKVIQDMPKENARELSIESIRAIYNFNRKK